MSNVFPVEPYKRNYLSANLSIENWSDLVNFVKDLEFQEINSASDLLLFMHKKNELDVVINEQHIYHKLNSYRFVNDEEKRKGKTHFNTAIFENYKKAKHNLNQKILNSKYLENLLIEKPEFSNMITNFKDEKAIYSDKNLELYSEIDELKSDYNKIVAAQRIEVNGEEMPIFKATKAFKDEPTAVRKEKSKLIEQRLLDDEVQLHTVFDKMVRLRHKIAEQAGFENFRDYIWVEKSRHDYTPEDCERVCLSIENKIIPIFKDLMTKRKEWLGQEEIFKCDLAVELKTNSPVIYPKSSEELSDKIKKIFYKINPEFGEIFEYLEKNERLDFENRKNKAVAMFCSYAPETRLPFVFYMLMESLHDVHGSIHESTHALHYMYCNHFSLEKLKEPCDEVAELFTLSMELISMEYWDVFFEDKNNLLNAKLKKLESSFWLFHMAALWDKFQQWVYLNPFKTLQEKNAYWDKLSKDYDIGISSALNIAPEKNNGWQHRGLIYFAPFYLIEYVFAQLGAFEIYRQYKINPEQTTNNLISAMKTGNTLSIRETYKKAGVKFDFSEENFIEISQFVKSEMDAIINELNFA